MGEQLSLFDQSPVPGNESTELTEAQIAAIAAAGSRRNGDYDPTRVPSAAAEDQGFGTVTTPPPSKRTRKPRPSGYVRGFHDGVAKPEERGTNEPPLSPGEKAAGIEGVRAVLNNARNQ